MVWPRLQAALLGGGLGFLVVGGGVGLVVGGAGGYWWATRPNPALAGQLAQADSAIAQRGVDSVRIAQLLSRVDSISSTAARERAEAAAALAAAQAIAHAPIPRPAPTAVDSLRFWEDSATQAQTAFTAAVGAAALALLAADTLRALVDTLRPAIVRLQAEKTNLLSQVTKLSQDLKRTRTCAAWCPGLLVGYGYGLNGTPTLFVGVGFRANPLDLVRRIMGGGA